MIVKNTTPLSEGGHKKRRKGKQKKGNHVPPLSTPVPRPFLDPRPGNVCPDSVLFLPESPGTGGVSQNDHDQVNLAGGLSHERSHV